MIHSTCTSCRTYQKVTADHIERIDDGVFGSVAWYRCVGCEQTAPTRAGSFPGGEFGSHGVVLDAA